MPSRTDPFATIGTHRLFCEERGFDWGEVRYSSNGEASVDVEGHGELIELYYRRSRTGYWRFACAYVHESVTADKHYTWKSISNVIDGIYQDATERYWERRSEDFYGSSAPQPSDKPNNPLDRLLDEKGEW